MHRLLALLSVAAFLLAGPIACQPSGSTPRSGAPHAGARPADSLRMDALRADSLRADSLQTDALRADSLRALGAMQDSGAVTMPALERQRLVANDSLWAEALRIHYNAIVMDGHIDTPLLMADDGYNLSQRHTWRRSHNDLPRMTQGGLDAPFFSIYVAPYYGEGARAVRRARAVMEEVQRQVEAADATALATTAADVRRIARSGRKAILMGLEGGHALAASPDTLHALADAGIRYVTLTHVNTNRWADSSQDAPQHNGLSDLGRRMVRTMNDRGVLVDLAHVSDSTFFDAVETSRAPVIVSHSSCRHLTPTVRNLSDAQLRAVAQTGGVVMVNFFDAMVNPQLDSTVYAAAHARLDRQGKSLRSLWGAVYAEKRARGLAGAALDDVLDHIDHAVQVAGIDHVALGSDFDGVFDLPTGLRDVTRLPWITYGLLKRGYTEPDLLKILGGNTLRVLEAADREANAPPGSPGES
mgnify:CR=1 FL=1